MNEERKDHSEGSLDDKKYQNPAIGDVNVPNAPNSKEEKEMQKIREKLEDFKKFILTNVKVTSAIGIIPPQAAALFDEENEFFKILKFFPDFLHFFFFFRIGSV